MFKVPKWGVEMAQSVTPYTHPWQSKLTTISMKMIYLPGLHLTGYLGLRGLTPQNSVKIRFFVFRRKTVSSQAKKIETSPNLNPEKRWKGGRVGYQKS